MRLDLFSKKEIIKFNKQFYKKEFEMLVLMVSESYLSSIIVGSGICEYHVDFAASINLETCEFSSKVGKLEWINKLNDKNETVYNFEKYKIYQVKVRKRKKMVLEKNQNDVSNNCYMLVDVLKEIKVDERLAKVKEELLKPVIIENTLGIFNLNRVFDIFEGKINWMSKECIVRLDTDKPYEVTAYNSFKILYNIIENMTTLDNMIKIKSLSLFKKNLNEKSKMLSKKAIDAVLISSMYLSDIDINSNDITFYICSDLITNITIFVKMTTDYECLDVAIAF